MTDDLTKRMREAFERRQAERGTAGRTKERGGTGRGPASHPHPAPPAPRPPRPVTVPPARRPPAPRPARGPRSRAGLGSVSAVGHAAGLTALCWQLLWLTGWSVTPLHWSGQVETLWRLPLGAAEAERGNPGFADLGRLVLAQGPGAAHPWLYPLVASVLVLLLRAFRPPPALQALLGAAAAGYGLLALAGTGPPVLDHWPVTAVLLAVTLPAVSWVRRS